MDNDPIVLRHLLSQLDELRDTVRHLLEGAGRVDWQCTTGEAMPVIKARVAKVFGVALTDLRGRGREEVVVVPRQVAMYLCRQAGYSYKVIGREFERNHVTVMHACRCIRNRIKIYPKLAAKVEEASKP